MPFILNNKEEEGGIEEEEIELLRDYNGLRTVYDIKDATMLEDIVDTIRDIAPEEYYDDDEHKLFHKKKDEFLYNAQHQRMELYCNRIINMHMAMFHVQILPMSFHKNALYADYSTMTTDYRLHLLSTVLTNLHFNSKYYVNYGKRIRVASPLMLMPYLTFRQLQLQ